MIMLTYLVFSAMCASLCYILYGFTRKPKKRVILPISHAVAVAHQPDSVLSFQAYMDSEVFMKDKTGYPDRIEESGNVLRHDLNKNIGKLIPAIAEECDHSFRMEFVVCDNWMPITPNQVLPRLVNRMTGRALLGKELCRNDEWQELSLEFMHLIFEVAAVIKSYPASLQYLVSFVLPQTRRIRELKRRVRKIVIPLLKAKMSSAYQPEEAVIGTDGSGDAMQWLQEALQPHARQKLSNLAMAPLRYQMVAVHTTSLTLVNVLYDLAAHPKYIQELRDEATLAYAQEGITKKALSLMTKMDSVMKESIRMHPIVPTALNRKVLREVTLQTGAHLTKNSLIAIDPGSHLMDSAIYFNPEAFDGYRFYRQREKTSAGVQFVTTTDGSLHFGYGATACPGRFLAEAVIKLILVKMLTEFNFELKDVDGKKVFMFQRRRGVDE